MKEFAREDERKGERERERRRRTPFVMKRSNDSEYSSLILFWIVILLGQITMATFSENAERTTSEKLIL